MQPAFSGVDDTALAVPRASSRRDGSQSLPQPLPPSEAARLRRIFALQRAGDLRAAEKEMALLDPDLSVAGIALGAAMRGYILADRHLGPYTRPGAAELKAWLEKWSDLTDAPAIHTLMLSRLPRGAAAPPAPNTVMLSADIRSPGSSIPVPEEANDPGTRPVRNAALDRSVYDAARNGGAAAVERLLQRRRGLAPDYGSLLRGEAAQILFTLNRDEEAYALGAAGLEACRGAGSTCRVAALAGKMAGLAAWRLDQPDRAAAAFAAGWRAELSSPTLRAANAFWAARARLRLREPRNYVPWMMRAAEEQRTFYGMLARRTLGLDIGFAPGGRQTRETLGEADLDAVMATPEGLRALALLQIGERDRAEAELRQLWPLAETTPALGRAVMLVAQRARLLALTAQLADLVQVADGRSRDDLRFTVPRLRPSGGFIVDPALIYGITRTESNFDQALTSGAGALGLMQIMPETASFITGRPDDAILRGRLRDPAMNLELGQRYIVWLADTGLVDGDLIRLLAGYNAGPGSVMRWAPAIRDNGDPLLFIESIPIDETRAYVPRVLTYTWIFAARLHLPTPSLDELAAGAWPRYHPLELRHDAVARLN
ncbi:lytic transglycosylase domain-containing protein [Rhodovastum atsumiense]|uniref:lytic transglycosylase domain-containing protein n=1 Tax=Rhodovastum atsumiense TaxID=504468 RepID=UPI00139F2A2D|nr:lytic transglycosylase domain-containing protein [Rhodovastum atsumiense]